MANESGKLLVKDLDPDDLNLLRESGINLSAYVRERIHAEAEALRAQLRRDYRRQVRDEVRKHRPGNVSTEDIVNGILADRADRGVA